jgi:hypothetical protein
MRRTWWRVPLLTLSFLAGPALAEEQGTAQQAGKTLPPSIGRADRDEDGYVSREEYLADAGRRFSRLDSNGDGVVDKAEIDAAAERIAQRIRTAMTRAQERADSDHDGRLTRAESEAAAANRFAALDADASGRLDAGEFRRRPRRPAVAKAADGEGGSALAQ